MKLQRYNVWVDTDGSNTVDSESPRGEYYRAADVDALLARIRAAVEAERAAPPCECVALPCWQACENGQARNALDALLADGGV